MNIDIHLNQVREKVKANDRVMAEARTRRDVSLAAARTFRGVRYSYRSGGVAMGVTNDPVSDADGGIVLDRRCHPTLGPDGGGELPEGIVSELHAHLGPKVRAVYPKATVRDMKRGVSICFHEPIEGQDPYVDVVVAMERVEEPGLWVPNLSQGRWDPSDPERHVEMMLAGPAEVRRVRARVVRLAKAWNNQFSEPAFCLFNIVAFGLAAITVSQGLGTALHTMFDYAATSLNNSLTADPAGVSGPIKTAVRKDIAVKRLRDARDDLATALTTTDEDEAYAAVQAVFWTHLSAPTTVSSKQQLADLLRTGPAPVLRPGVGGLVVAGTAKPYRSYGS